MTDAPLVGIMEILNESAVYTYCNRCERRLHLGNSICLLGKELLTMHDQSKEFQPMYICLTKCFICSLKEIFLLLAMSIFLIEAATGCAEINTRESMAPGPSSFSVYALSRGKGVPDEAREVLDRSRRLLKSAQEQGEVKKIVEHRIGLEGETRLCVEFSDEQAANRLFGQIQHLSNSVDLVNVKKELCPP